MLEVHTHKKHCKEGSLQYTSWIILCSKSSSTCDETQVETLLLWKCQVPVLEVHTQETLQGRQSAVHILCYIWQYFIQHLWVKRVEDFVILQTAGWLCAWAGFKPQDSKVCQAAVSLAPLVLGLFRGALNSFFSCVRFLKCEYCLHQDGALIQTDYKNALPFWSRWRSSIRFMINLLWCFVISVTRALIAVPHRCTWIAVKHKAIMSLYFCTLSGARHARLTAFLLGTQLQQQHALPKYVSINQGPHVIVEIAKTTHAPEAT